MMLKRGGKLLLIFLLLTGESKEISKVRVSEWHTRVTRWDPIAISSSCIQRHCLGLPQQGGTCVK